MHAGRYWAARKMCLTAPSWSRLIKQHKGLVPGSRDHAGGVVKELLRSTPAPQVKPRSWAAW